MHFAVYILVACCLWIAVLGQEDTKLETCGQRWKTQKPANFNTRQKREAQPNSWPWHVGVYSAALGAFPFCGGTLIARKWVLTAAHCIKGALQCRHVAYGQLFNIKAVTGHEMAVSLADHQYTAYDRPKFNRRVSGVIIHPLYGQGYNGFDMALLQLSRDVKRSPHTEYACLPGLGLTVPVGEFCYLAGWGQLPNPPNMPIVGLPEKLMELQLQIISAEVCKTKQGSVNEEQDVCTDGTYAMACKGDSGGGLHCFNGSRWVVYGVSTYGKRLCFGGHNGYALTAPKVEWINNIMASYP